MELALASICLWKYANGPRDGQLWQGGGDGAVVRSCLTLVTQWTIYSLPGSSVRGILQARILEWVAISLVRILHGNMFKDLIGLIGALQLVLKP